jgi:hypothetical protein
MVIPPFSLEIGRADLLFFRRYAMVMVMVMFLSLLELEGQTPSSLEDMP